MHLQGVPAMQNDQKCVEKFFVIKDSCTIFQCKVDFIPVFVNQKEYSWLRMVNLPWRQISSAPTSKDQP